MEVREGSRMLAIWEANKDPRKEMQRWTRFYSSRERLKRDMEGQHRPRRDAVVEWPG